ALARSTFMERWITPARSWASPPAEVGVQKWPPLAATDAGLSLAVVDRAGRPLRSLTANRPWTPRFSPDGRMIAYGAYGAGRGTSDIWVTDLATDATRRVTDDDADSNDPQWSADGASVLYSVNAPGGKDLSMQPIKGGRVREVAKRDGTQYPSDWLRDGS